MVSWSASSLKSWAYVWLASEAHGWLVSTITGWIIRMIIGHLVGRMIQMVGRYAHHVGLMGHSYSVLLSINHL